MITDLNFLVTLGCPERCPTIPDSRRQAWKLHGLSVGEVRGIRDEIRRLVTDLVRDEGWGVAPDDSLRPFGPKPVSPNIGDEP